MPRALQYSRYRLLGIPPRRKLRSILDQPTQGRALKYVRGPIGIPPRRKLQEVENPITFEGSRLPTGHLAISVDGVSCSR